MRRLFLAAALLVFAAPQALSQVSDEKSVRQTLDELMTALNSNDTDAAGRIYSDDYIIVLADGSTTTKAQRLAAMKSGELKYRSLAVGDLKVRQYGDTAVANYRVTGKTVGRAGEQDVSSQAMVMLVKRDGRWWVVSSQLTDNAVSQSGAGDEKALNQALDGYLNALTKNSADETGPFLSKDWVRVGGDGSIINREQALAALRSGELKYSSLAVDERVWRTFGNDMAVATSRVLLKATHGGRDIGGIYRATTLMRREGGRWALASTHLSPLAAK